MHRQKVPVIIDTYVVAGISIKMRGFHPTKRMEALVFCAEDTGRPSAIGLAAH